MDQSEALGPGTPVEPVSCRTTRIACGCYRIYREARSCYSKLYAHDQSSPRTRLRDTDARYKRSMGEGALAPLINDSVDPYDRYEHVGEGVFIAPLIKGLRPPTISMLCASATKRGSAVTS